MKKTDLERALRALGFEKVSDKGPHEKWSNGNHTEPVPRHREINEITAMKILKRCKEAAGK